MTSFFNSATVVLGQFGAPTGESSVAAQLAATVSAVGSGSVLPHWSVLTFCPAASMTSFEALLAPLLVPALMLASLALVALTIFALERRRGRPPPSLELNDGDDGGDVPALPLVDGVAYRIAVSFLSVVDFVLFAIVSACLSLLNTIEVPGVGCRLWKAGDVECSTGVAATAATTMAAVLVAPVAFFWWQRRWPASTFGRAVATVHQSPMRAELPFYNIVLIARRVLLAVSFALVQDAPLRSALIRSVLVVSLTLHTQLSPFATTLQNRLETAALFALLIATALHGEEVLLILQLVLLAMALAMLAVFALRDALNRKK